MASSPSGQDVLRVAIGSATVLPLAKAVPNKATRKADPAGIYVFHNHQDGVSLGMELAENGKVTAALAVCSPRDQFSKKKAQKILRGRLASKRFVSTDKSNVVLTFPLGTYKGDRFKDDVFQPSLEFVRDNAYLFLARDSSSDRRHANGRFLLRKLVNEIITIISYDQAHLV